MNWVPKFLPFKRSRRHLSSLPSKQETKGHAALPLHPLPLISHSKRVKSSSNFTLSWRYFSLVFSSFYISFQLLSMIKIWSSEFFKAYFSYHLMWLVQTFWIQIFGFLGLLYLVDDEIVALLLSIVLIMFMDSVLALFLFVSTKKDNKKSKNYA